jgi:hypothetical protein
MIKNNIINPNQEKVLFNEIIIINLKTQYKKLVKKKIKNL